MTIQRGDRVVVRTAFGELIERRALTGVEPGYGFPIVRVCTENDWVAAQADGRSGTAFPAKDVELAPEQVPR